jgi:hypothetical protein
VTADVSDEERLDGGRTKGRLVVSADFAAIAEALERVGPPRARVTVAVEIPGKTPFVSHEDVAIEHSGEGSVWYYEAGITWAARGDPRLGDRRGARDRSRGRRRRGAAAAVGTRGIGHPLVPGRASDRDASGRGRPRAEKQPAHLLLDSRPACELTARAPGCMVDLGASPRIHLLELVRTDAEGRVTERVGRWVNRPGIHPEVIARGACDEKAGSCDFDFSWAHPRKLDPDRLDLSLDGRAVWHGRERHAHVALAKGAKPQILVLDARFSDGTRASFTKTLYAFYPEEARAHLQAVPVLPAAGPDPPADERIAAALRDAGFAVRAVEEADAEIGFVFEPRSFDVIPKFLGLALDGKILTSNPARFFEKAANPLPVLRVVVPDQFLTTFQTRAAYLGARTPVGMTATSRFADAVAAAGYALGGEPRRRAVVLVLHRGARPDVSTFTANQARAYLSEVMVPLVVWRVGTVVAPEWPEGRSIATMSDLRGAFDALAADVARQRLAWVEGAVDLSQSARGIAPGVELAGRVPGLPGAASAAPVSIAGRSVGALGPDGGPVHALATSGDGGTAWAGTHAGVFRSRDGGATWERASAGLPPVPVTCLLRADGVLLAGTDAGLFASGDDGSTWKPAGGLDGRAILALAAAPSTSPPAIYAGVRGVGVLRSGDSGATFAATAIEHGDVRSLAVESDGAVWAASEAGVSRSADGGATWKAAAPLPSRALALAASPRGGRVWAATAGRGVFSSDDSGKSWRRTGLSDAVLFALEVADDAKTLVARRRTACSASATGLEVEARPRRSGRRPRRRRIRTWLAGRSRRDPAGIGERARVVPVERGPGGGARLHRGPRGGRERDDPRRHLARACSAATASRGHHFRDAGWSSRLRGRRAVPRARRS